jgi:pilus assembly protein Flp/PilA
MSKFIHQFVHDERGVTAIEYGLIAGVLALGIMTAVTTLSTDLSAAFTAISNHLASVH